MRRRSDQETAKRRINKKERGTITIIENYADFGQKRRTRSYDREEHKKNQCFL